MELTAGNRPRWTGLWYQPRVRGWIAQALVAIVLAGLVWFFIGNAVGNVSKRHLTSGFGFLWSTAGFVIDDTLIDWDPTDSYGRALLVGVLNTILVGSLGVVLSTMLGVVVALMRISSNLLAQSIARAFVEFVRNTPEILQIIFWYFAVLQSLPPPRQSLELGWNIFLNVRGVYLPDPVLSDGAASLGWGLACGLAILALAVTLRKPLRLSRVVAVGAGFTAIIAMPNIVAAVSGAKLSWELPAMQGFNFSGGLHLYPEFIALLVGLTIYSAAFISEIVRAGIQAVDRGQIEAARSLGLPQFRIVRFVIVPQALRIIVPPLTSQDLNLVKGSSLAVAIGYPDIVQIFAGTVLNQSGQAIEVMSITMLIYLSFSLLISAYMNWYNRRVTRVVI
jgi:general L-amino acid transport system permease protein